MTMRPFLTIVKGEILVGLADSVVVQDDANCSKATGADER